MNTYNSFNELATAQETSPLVSDMSVFNAVTSKEVADYYNAYDDALKAMGKATHAFVMAKTSDMYPDMEDVVKKFKRLQKAMQDVFAEGYHFLSAHCDDDAAPEA